jgi:protoheme IX farnesyltransferase
MKDAAVPASHAVSLRTLADYVALTKPRLNVLVVATSAAGFYLGANGPIDPLTFVTTSFGTTLVAGGAAALNQVYERDTDKVMRRTRMRPLPDGRISPTEALVFGLLLSAAGLILLLVYSTWLAALLALATLVIYLLIYTPLKRRTPLATIIGAVPGALPALIGWTAARGLTLGGLSLFLIVFLWQMPHFMAIAWMYRDDYGAAGFPMLPVVDPTGRRAGNEAVGYAAALLPVSLIPAFIGLSGLVYLAVAGALSVVLLALAVGFGRARTDARARRLFFGSLIYLPLIWTVMMLDKQ